MINQIEDFRRLIENKDRLIDRLDLSEDKKQILKDFFNKHPNYENKIDWNRHDLSWSDFEDLLATEGKSISQAKKNGLAGLTEGVDYNIIYQDDVGTLYEVLTHLASKTLASEKVGTGTVAKWCISMNQPTYWKQYKGNGYQFFFWIRTKDNGRVRPKYTKIALAYPRRSALNKCKENRSIISPKWLIRSWIQYFDADDQKTLWQIVEEDFPLVETLSPYIEITQKDLNFFDFEREINREKLEALINPEQSHDFGFGYSFVHPTENSLYVRILKMLQKNGPMGKRDILIELTKMRAMPLRTEVWKWGYDPEKGYRGKYVPTDPDAFWQNSENTVSGQYSSLFGAMKKAALLSYSQHTRKWSLGPNAGPYMEHYHF